MGPLEQLTWRCATNPCGVQPVTCSCAGDLCQTIVGLCQAGVPGRSDIRCVGGGPCAAPDTPVATPDGERPIASLRPGDPVYSVHRNALLVVPIARVQRTPVVGHEVVRLSLAGGRVLEISARHPMPDGRAFGDLRVGELVDGVRVLVREVVPYRLPATYDILPASDSGSYVSAGLILGSSVPR
jgi:hypothetical protein